jgi:hypothetical protein
MAFIVSQSDHYRIVARATPFNTMAYLIEVERLSRDAMGVESWTKLEIEDIALLSKALSPAIKELENYREAANKPNKRKGKK